MVQWVSKVKAAETAEDIKNWHKSSPKWKPMTLNTLFCGTKPSLPLRIVEADEEEVMQQIMAEALEDGRPDDGAISKLIQMINGNRHFDCQIGRAHV